MGKRASTFLMIGVVAIIMLAALVFVNRELIFQEGNPLPVAGGIWKIAVNGEPYAKIKDEPATWVTNNVVGKPDALFTYIEDSYGVQYQGNEDNKFKFEGEGKQLTVSRRQYSRSFQIWEIEQR